MKCQIGERKMTHRSKIYADGDRAYEAPVPDKNDFQGKRLRRNKTDGVLGGVCAGFGDYFGINHNAIRIVFVLSVIFLSFPLLGYVLLWIIIPKEKSAPYRRAHHDTFETPRVRATDVRDATSKFSALETRLQDLERSVTTREWKLRRDFRDLES